MVTMDRKTDGLDWIAIDTGTYRPKPNFLPSPSQQ